MDWWLCNQQQQTNRGREKMSEKYTTLPDVIPVSVSALRSFVADILQRKADEQEGPYAPSPSESKKRLPNKFSLTQEIKQTVKYDFFKIIIASLLFVTALSWNDTFKDFFQSIEALQKAKLWVYSLSITVITLVVSRMYALYMKKGE